MTSVKKLWSSELSRIDTQSATIILVLLRTEKKVIGFTSIGKTYLRREIIEG